MVETIKYVLCAVGLTFLSAYALAQDHAFEWSKVEVDGSRTGVTASPLKSVGETIGIVDNDVYYAPNGRVFRRGAIVGTAKSVIDAQPAMDRVKRVIGYAACDMRAARPESALSNWFVDELMKSAENEFGRKVDVGIANFGGIRTSLSKGEILVDDMMSMFPFRNNLCYVSLKGSDLKRIFVQLARRPEVIGGARMTIKDGELTALSIGGEPLDEEKVYGVVTNSFLLDGGDGISVARNAQELDISEKLIIDVIIPAVESLTAEGRKLEYEKDGRVTVL